MTAAARLGAAAISLTLAKREVLKAELSLRRREGRGRRILDDEARGLDLDDVEIALDLAVGAEAEGPVDSGKAFRPGDADIVQRIGLGQRGCHVDRVIGEARQTRRIRAETGAIALGESRPGAGRRGS